jgi:RimJ/RimL family protein N-acetyltransferase
MIASHSHSPSSFFDSTLTSRRLILKPYSEDRDFPNIEKMLSDPRVTGPMGIPVPNFFTEELKRAKKERSERIDAGDWTIFLTKAENETFIGEVGIAEWNSENHIVEIFAAISPDHAGKAYGREAVSTLIERIFSAAPIAQIRTQALETNVGSINLALKLGFRESGTRFVEADPGRGFAGGLAVIMDLRSHEFRRFEIEKQL